MNPFAYVAIGLLFLLASWFVPAWMAGAKAEDERFNDRHL